MGLVQRLWAWLTSPRSRKPGKAHPDLYPIDIDRLAIELRLAEGARRLGEAGLPAADAKDTSGPEAAIVQRVEKIRQDYVDWGALRLNILNTDLSSRDITKDVNKATQADAEFDRKASGLFAKYEPVLRGLGDLARTRRQELAEFKRENNLSREANVPSGSRVVFQYALLIFFIVAEGIVNASFFAKGLDTGLVGGFVQAVTMAGLNVLVAFCFGKFVVPYVNHARTFAKAAGFAGFFLALLLMLAVGLGIAHYRDGLVAELPDPARAAVDSIASSPFNLTDIFSWALLLISVIFGVLAFVDGYLSDDTYPGYGKIFRRTQQAVDDYETELAELREGLQELKDDELDQLDKTLKRAQSDISVIESLIHDKETSGSRLRTAMADADNSLDALLKIFRTENELHRGGTPRPKYFDTRPRLRPVQLPDFDTHEDEERLQEQKRKMASLVSEEQDLRARIQAAFTQQFDRLKSVDAHFPSKETT